MFLFNLGLAILATMMLMAVLAIGKLLLAPAAAAEHTAASVTYFVTEERDGEFRLLSTKTWTVPPSRSEAARTAARLEAAGWNKPHWTNNDYLWIRKVESTTRGKRVTNLEWRFAEERRVL